MTVIRIDECGVHESPKGCQAMAFDKKDLEPPNVSSSRDSKYSSSLIRVVAIHLFLLCSLFVAKSVLSIGDDEVRILLKLQTKQNPIGRSRR